MKDDSCFFTSGIIRLWIVGEFSVFPDGNSESHGFVLPFDGAQADKAKACRLPDWSWEQAFANYRVDCHP
ncbi:hypothetical protein MARINOS108_11285 [Marinoscillum sp. 108]|nr:hypothetical protein MARINOS108_11285 [Marinoscillum sp. 108]